MEKIFTVIGIKESFISETVYKGVYKTKEEAQAAIDYTPSYTWHILESVDVKYNASRYPMESYLDRYGNRRIL